MSFWGYHPDRLSAAPRENTWTCSNQIWKFCKMQCTRSFPGQQSHVLLTKSCSCTVTWCSLCFCGCLVCLTPKSDINVLGHWNIFCYQTWMQLLQTSGFDLIWPMVQRTTMQKLHKRDFEVHKQIHQWQILFNFVAMCLKVDFSFKTQRFVDKDQTHANVPKIIV